MTTNHHLSAEAIARAVDAAHGVSAFDRAVYQGLAAYCFFDADKVFPSQQLLADDLGCERRQVGRAIKRLQRAGWLEITREPRSDELVARLGPHLWEHNVYGLLHAWKPMGDRVGTELTPAPPTPPGVRVRTGRFAQHSRKQR